MMGKRSSTQPISTHSALRFLAAAWAVALLAMILALASGCAGGAKKAAPAATPPAPTAKEAIPAAPEAAEIPTIRTDEFFCMNGIVPFHHKVSGDPNVTSKLWDDLRYRLRLIKEHGCHSVRIDMWRGVIEPEKGRFDWEFPDRVINEILSAGLEPYPILCYNSAWEPNQSPATPEACEDFGVYVRAMVDRYKETITWWEVWNEPNITPFWVPKPDAALYAELLKVAYREAKAANPKCKIVAMCTAGADYPFIEGVYRQGASAFLDAVSFHHYDGRPDEKVLRDEILQIRRIMEKYGDGAKPLFITELGLSTGKSPVIREVSANFQASWIVKKHLVALAAGVSRLYYFKLSDDYSGLNPDGYWGVLDYLFKPKVSSGAYKAMSTRLANAEFVGSVHGAAVDPERKDDIEVQIYRNASEILACAWVLRDGEAAQIRLPAEGAVLIEDMFGRGITTAEPDASGAITVEVKSEPRYIRGLPLRALPLASVRFVPSVLYLPPGESRPISLVVNNPLPEALEISLDPLIASAAGSPVHFQADQKSFSCPPGRTSSFTCSASLDANAKPFQPRQFTGGEPLRYSYSLDVCYSVPFEIRLLPQKSGNNYTLTTYFQNCIGRTASGKAQWTLRGADSGPANVFSDLLAGASASAERNMKPALGPCVIQARVTEEKGAVAEKVLRGWGQPLCASAPGMGAPAEEWNRLPQISLTPSENQIVPAEGARLSAEEFSANARVGWTADTLILAVDVVDSTPLINPNDNTEIWRGDSIELYLGFDGPTLDSYYGPKHFQIGLTPGDKGQGGYAWNWRPIVPEGEKAPEGGRGIEGSEVVAYPRPNGWRIEAYIPLSEFGATITAGQLIGFDMAVNNGMDRNDREKRATLMWNGDGQNWRNPSGWGFAAILPEKE